MNDWDNDYFVAGAAAVERRTSISKAKCRDRDVLTHICLPYL